MNKNLHFDKNKLTFGKHYTKLKTKNSTYNTLY